MAKITGPTPASITKEEFQNLLGQYEKLIEKVSASKNTKPSQKTLAELDTYRYEEAPSLFSLQDAKKTMGLSDVKTLVEWKLKHGKFRPTLMKLVSSNEESFVSSTIQAAMDAYRQNSNASAAVDALAKLKGVGPATASLLLAVHDPDKVIFFADEAFYWLCCDGRKDAAAIKYSAKEYKVLHGNAQELAKRIAVRAVDIERVAYVLMTMTTTTSGAGTAAKPAGKPTASSSPDAHEPKADSKRKQNDDGTDKDAPAPRRSKRRKPA